MGCLTANNLHNDVGGYRYVTFLSSRVIINYVEFINSPGWKLRIDSKSDQYNCLKPQKLCFFCKYLLLVAAIRWVQNCTKKIDLVSVICGSTGVNSTLKTIWGILGSNFLNY